MRLLRQVSCIAHLLQVPPPAVGLGGDVDGDSQRRLPGATLHDLYRQLGNDGVRGLRVAQPVRARLLEALRPACTAPVRQQPRILAEEALELLVERIGGDVLLRFGSPPTRRGSKRSRCLAAWAGRSRADIPTDGEFPWRCPVSSYSLPSTRAMRDGPGVLSVDRHGSAQFFCGFGDADARVLAVMKGTRLASAFDRHAKPSSTRSGGCAIHACCRPEGDTCPLLSPRSAVSRSESPARSRRAPHRAQMRAPTNADDAMTRRVFPDKSRPLLRSSSPSARTGSG
jgi:hypothetical protein